MARLADPGEAKNGLSELCVPQGAATEGPQMIDAALDATPGLQLLRRKAGSRACGEGSAAAL